MTEESRHTRFPYRPPKSRGQHLKPVKMEDEGTEGKVARFGWMTDGAVRPTERGLPLAGPSELRQFPSDTLMTLLIEKPYVKAFNRTYGALAAQHPEYDLADPDMMSNFEKQLIATYSPEQTSQTRANELRLVIPGTQIRTTKIPMDAHLHTWGGSIPYLGNDIFPEDDGVVPPPVQPRWRPRTGIHGEVNAKAEDESSIIRPVEFRTLSESEAKDRSLSRDSATSPLLFPPGAKRAESRLLGLPTGTTDPTVQNCVKQFFDPAVGIPFVPADVGKHFPVSLLIPENPSPIESEEEMEIATPEEPEPPSTLLDTSQEDVLFTKNKAPFTRSDISAVRAFGRHWDALKIRKRDQAVRALRERQRIIKQAFHSKSVLETTLGLIEQDCQRIRSGVLRTSAFKHKSIWETAIETAPPDHSGLAERREIWWRLCAFVRFLGGIQEEHEKNFLRLIRLKLMLRHQVDQSLFWDIIKETPQNACESVAVLKLAEFMRVAVAVGQQEFSDYLENMKVAQMMYSQTIKTNLSKEYLDKQSLIAHGPIEVPQSE
jgi:hypothetical protein